MKKSYILLISSLILVSCYISRDISFTLTAKNERKLRNYLVESFNKNNSVQIKKRGLAIWVHQISKTEKNCSIFNFGMRGSHTSKKNIFLYEHGKINILECSDTVQLKKEIDSFFIRNEFNTDEIKDCNNKIQKIMQESNSDIF